MRKNLKCLLLSLLLVLSAFALSASANPYNWKTPWKGNSVYITKLPTAAHSISGSNSFLCDFGIVAPSNAQTPSETFLNPILASCLFLFVASVKILKDYLG
jgi:hypothetical protein